MKNRLTKEQEEKFRDLSRRLIMFEERARKARTEEKMNEWEQKAAVAGRELDNFIEAHEVQLTPPHVVCDPHRPWRLK